MLLIDGHNLIGQMPDLSMADPNDEEQLLIRLRAYRAGAGVDMVVYFDPGLTYQPPARRSEVGITIRRAAIGQQADDLIVQDVARYGHPRDLTVVTSDRAVQRAARERGCRVVDAASFVADLKHPARRKTRRVRTRAKAESGPSLSKREVKEWLQVFDQPSRATKPKAVQRRG
jgi:hypothetical protein